MGIVYRAFSPSRKPDICDVHYDRGSAEREVARRNIDQRTLGTNQDDYILQQAEVNWVPVAGKGE